VAFFIHFNSLGTTLVPFEHCENYIANDCNLSLFYILPTKYIERDDYFSLHWSFSPSNSCKFTIKFVEPKSNDEFVRTGWREDQWHVSY
jgi:hypothetical protein